MINTFATTCTAFQMASSALRLQITAGACQWVNTRQTRAVDQHLRPMHPRMLLNEKVRHRGSSLWGQDPAHLASGIDMSLYQAIAWKVADCVDGLQNFLGSGGELWKNGTKERASQQQKRSIVRSRQSPSGAGQMLVSSAIR